MQGKKILLLRPFEDSQLTASLLKERGYSVVVSPVMEIVFSTPPKIHNQSLILTSQNGVRALETMSKLSPQVPVYAVGEKTAAKLKGLGFTNILTAEGDASSLVDKMIQSAPRDASYLHLSGEDLALDVTAILKTQGFKVTREIVYKAEPTASLTPEALSAIREGCIGGVFLYSPRSVRLFQDQIKKENLAHKLSNSYGFCLSEAIAKEVQVCFPGMPYRTSKKKTTEGLIELLDELSFSPEDCHARPR